MREQREAGAMAMGPVTSWRGEWGCWSGLGGCPGQDGWEAPPGRGWQATFAQRPRAHISCHRRWRQEQTQPWV